MSNIIFPENYIIELSDLNIEMMKYYSQQWNLEHMEMGRGKFEGHISAIHTPHIQLGCAYYSKRMICKGDFPDGCVVLMYSGNNVKYNFQNRLINTNEIIILTNGDEIDVITYGEFDAYTIVIEEKLFYQTFYNYFGETPHKIIKDKRFFVKDNMMSFFYKIVDSWKNYLTYKYPTLNDKLLYDKIESEILRQLFSCILLKPLTKQRKKFQTKNVRDFLYEKVEHSIVISEIATELGISESQLHHAFKQEYGLSPKKYLLYLRYNAARKDLYLGHPHTDTVMDIAQKYQFYHMGHFSMEYQKLFGQKPSETLNSKYKEF